MRVRLILSVLLTFILGGMSYGQVPSFVPMDGLLGYWSLSGNGEDGSGNGHHGIVSSTTFATDRFGISGGATEFLTEESLVQIPGGALTGFNGSFTLSFWFRSEHKKRMHPVNLNGVGSNLNFAFNNTVACWSYWNSGGYFSLKVGQERDYTDGFWHHMVFTRDGATIKVYFDGVLKGTYENFPYGIGDGSDLFFSDPKFPWIGALDDVSIHSRALTLDEIKAVADPGNIAVVYPSKYCAFPPEFTTEIKWMTPSNVANIKVEYSVTRGKTWGIISDSIPANVQKLTWKTPPLPGNNCIIKISDLDDSNTVGISDTFLISRYRWNIVNPSPPFSIRDGASAYSFNDRMYLIGGWNPTDPVNYPSITNSEVWESVDGQNWDLAAIAPWEPRHTYGTLIHEGKMWVLGGDQIQCKFQPDIWNSEDGRHWNLINENAPWGERSLHLYASFKGKMWIMGGQKIVYCSNTDEVNYNDVWNSSNGLQWEKITDAAPWSPRGQIAGTCIFKDKMWILGGGLYQKKYYNDIWNTEDGVNWNLVLKEAPWDERQYHAVSVFDSSMWVLQGRLTSDRNDVWFSSDGDKWHNLVGTPWSSRHAAAITNYNGSLWMMTGFLWNDVWRMDVVPCPKNSAQPENKILSWGDSTILVATYPSPTPEYLWQVQNGEQWVSIDGNGLSLNSGGDTLTIEKRFYNEQFALRYVGGEGSCRDTSQVVLVSICGPFVENPASTAVQDGAEAVFSAHFSDDADYQWQMQKGSEWVDLVDLGVSGASSNKLIISQAQLESDGSVFRSEATYGQCVIYSEPATLEICRTFTQQPSDQETGLGSNVNFSVIHPEATSFQWQGRMNDEWINLNDLGQYSGTQSTTMQITNVSWRHHLQEFRCLAFSECELISDHAKLYVQGTSSQLEIYPNPTSENLVVLVKQESPEIKRRYVVFNEVGQAVLSGELSDEVSTLSLQNIPSGMYLIQVTGVDRPVKFIKE